MQRHIPTTGVKKTRNVLPVRRRWLSAFFGAALLAVAGAALVAIPMSLQPSGVQVDWRIATEPPLEVHIGSPAQGSVIQTLSAPGTVEVVEEAEIASQVMGKVIDVPVEQGDVVKKDDLLVKLDDTDAKARLDSVLARINGLNAAIALADADLAKAVRDLSQLRELAKRNVTTINELADAQTMVDKMKAALEMSRQDLVQSEASERESRQFLEYTEIRAPMDGVVLDLDVEVGEIVIAGTTNLPGTVLMTVGDVSSMRVRAKVDETDVHLVESGQPARIYLQADQQHAIKGQVNRVAPKAKQQNAQTVTTEGVSFETLIDILESHSSLRAGMTATVEIEVRRADNVSSVPVHAVLHRRLRDLPDTSLFREFAASLPALPGEANVDRNSRYLKVVFAVENGVAIARPVETGLSDERHIEIRSGITPETPVIVGPFRVLDRLKDGQAVHLNEQGSEES